MLRQGKWEKNQDEQEECLGTTLISNIFRGNNYKNKYERCLLDIIQGNCVSGN